MAVINESELKMQLKNAEFSSFYVIYGDESFLKKHYVNSILKTALKEDYSDFNFHKLDGKAVTVDSIQEAVEALPVFSDFTCTLITDMQFENLSDSDKENLFLLLNDIPASSILIIYAETITPDFKKGSTWNKILDIAKKRGSVIKFDTPGQDALIRLVCAGAVKRNCKIDTSTAAYLVENVADDMSSVQNELEKVCAFTSGGQITRADIDEICVKSLESSAFDLAKAIAAKNIMAAFKILDNLFTQKAEPLMIVGALVSAYMDMYRVKAAKENGNKAEELAKFYNYKGKEFRLRNAERNAVNLSIEKLRSCLLFLCEADEKLKSTGLEPKNIIEQCMTKIVNV